MASNSIGKLRAIRTIPQRDGWLVGLAFIDGNGNNRIKLYKEERFKRALDLIATPERNNWIAGLKLLGCTTRRVGTFGEIYMLQMDDGGFLNLGSIEGPSGANNILVALNEKSLRPNEIRTALLNRHEHTWTFPQI